jgi:hypothetical protein
MGGVWQGAERIAQRWYVLIFELSLWDIVLVVRVLIIGCGCEQSFSVMFGVSTDALS